MEEINGKKIIPKFNFYNILINEENNIKNVYTFIIELHNLILKVKYNNKGIWIKIEESVYQKLDIRLLELLQRECKLYNIDRNENYLIFVSSNLEFYPPADYTNNESDLLNLPPPIPEPSPPNLLLYSI